MSEISGDPNVRTRTLARVAGPYLVVASFAMLARADSMALLLPAFMQDGPLVLATGAFTLALGLTILAAHHHFSSAAAIAITLIGALAAIKGALLMIAPELGAPLTAAAVRSPFLIIAIAIDLLLGLWLTYVGWGKNSSSGKSL